MNQMWIEHDWQSEIGRIHVSSIETWVPEPNVEPPVVSASFRKRKVKTNSYFFTEEEETEKPPSRPSVEKQEKKAAES